MFFVFNKDKIYTYCISIITIALLFCVAHIMIEEQKDSVTASTQEINEVQNTCINSP